MIFDHTHLHTHACTHSRTHLHTHALMHVHTHALIHSHTHLRRLGHQLCGSTRPKLFHLREGHASYYHSIEVMISTITLAYYQWQRGCDEQPKYIFTIILSQWRLWLAKNYVHKLTQVFMRIRSMSPRSTEVIILTFMPCADGWGWCNRYIYIIHVTDMILWR